MGLSRVDPAFWLIVALASRPVAVWVLGATPRASEQGVAAGQATVSQLAPSGWTRARPMNTRPLAEFLAISEALAQETVATDYLFLD